MWGDGKYTLDHVDVLHQDPLAVCILFMLPQTRHQRDVCAQQVLSFGPWNRLPVLAPLSAGLSAGHCAISCTAICFTTNVHGIQWHRCIWKHSVDVVGYTDVVMSNNTDLETRDREDEGQVKHRYVRWHLCEIVCSCKRMDTINMTRFHVPRGRSRISSDWKARGEGGGVIVYICDHYSIFIFDFFYCSIGWNRTWNNIRRGARPVRPL